MSQQLRDFLISNYTSGTLQGLLCPVCEGGRSKEHTFNIFEVSHGIIGYRCHRSSCGATGRCVVVGERRHETGAQAGKKTTSLPNIIKPDKVAEAQYAEQFGLHGPTVHQDSRGREWFVAWLRKHDGSRYGHHYRIIDRSQLGPGEPKAKTYKGEKYPLAFYRNSPYNRTLCVVEDPWSAQRIEALPSLQLDAAAICGGDWTKEMAEEVKGKYDHVLLVLDRDATAKAVKQALAHRHIQPVHVIVPRVDIKNMDNDEIIQTLSST